MLRGHEDLVTACLWNPVKNTIASCSSDGSARIWELDGVEKAGDNVSKNRDGAVTLDTSKVLKAHKDDGTYPPGSCLFPFSFVEGEDD